MSDEQYLIFSLHDSLYGISATLVQEIFWLPELSSLATAPTDILGMFNWRSQMVPMMHLDLRFGRGFSGCKVTDRAIVIKWQDTHLGIVAHEVYDVEVLQPQALDLGAIQDRQLQVDRNFITGIAQLKDQPVICLNLDSLIREPAAIAALDAPDLQVLAGSGADFYSRCCPQSTLADRATFATRAERLKVAVAETQGNTTDEGILVVQIGAEYIGFPMDLVVDVDTLDRFPVSPVPVAPSYILGQINWRGEILPMLELGSVLQIQQLPRQELVVVKIGDISVGIAVDRIFDVFYLNASQIDELPMAVNNQLRTYLRGVTRYSDSLMYLVKLQELIEREFLPAGVGT
jgi:purine-binding chemotaxis protein CheW